jgi:hypothetical protein
VAGWHKAMESARLVSDTATNVAAAPSSRPNFKPKKIDKAAPGHCSSRPGWDILLCVPGPVADSPDYGIFLSRRVRALTRNQPELRELRRILLKIGGTELLPPASGDPFTSFLVDFGIVFGGPMLLKACSRVTSSVALSRVWRRRMYAIIGIGVGYALAEDGLWREHCFGVLREGVLETVSRKEKYFGVLLIGEAADGFACCKP